MKIFEHIRRLCHNRDGVAFLEFAWAVPLFMLIFIGTIEISNFVYASQKAQSAAENILNVINLQDNVSTPQLASMSAMLPKIVRPFAVGEDQYRVIVTAIQRDIDEPFGHVRWQKAFGGAAGDSRFYYSESGTKEDNRVDPEEINGFVFQPGDQVLVVETYMFYQPILDVELMDDLLGLHNSYLYHSTPPTRPRTGKFQFHPDDLV